MNSMTSQRVAINSNVLNNTEKVMQQKDIVQVSDINDSEIQHELVINEADTQSLSRQDKKNQEDEENSTSQQINRNTNKTNVY